MYVLMCSDDANRAGVMVVTIQVCQVAGKGDDHDVALHFTPAAAGLPQPLSSPHTKYSAPTPPYLCFSCM